MFYFVLESCKHQVGRIERLYLCLVQQKTLQAQQVTFHSVHFTPPHLPDPPFRFSEGLAPRLNPCDVMHTVILLIHTLVAHRQSVSQILMSHAKNSAGPTLDL